MTLSKRELRLLLEGLLQTLEDEIGCDEALAGVPALAEAEIEKRPPDEARKRVIAHLELCPECDEEYRSLLLAIADRIDRTSP